MAQRYVGKVNCFSGGCLCGYMSCPALPERYLEGAFGYATRHDLFFRLEDCNFTPKKGDMVSFCMSNGTQEGLHTAYPKPIQIKLATNHSPEPQHQANDTALVERVSRQEGTYAKMLLKLVFYALQGFHALR